MYYANFVDTNSVYYNIIGSKGSIYYFRGFSILKTFYLYNCKYSDITAVSYASVMALYDEFDATVDSCTFESLSCNLTGGVMMISYETGSVISNLTLSSNTFNNVTAKYYGVTYLTHSNLNYSEKYSTYTNIDSVVGGVYGISNVK
jgi:hypothetical protein